MATATYLRKSDVVMTLRSRDLLGRASWVEKELPALIDTARNASLLQTLGIDVEALAPDAYPDHSVADSGQSSRPGPHRDEWRGPKFEESPHGQQVRP
jgi:hypothetical protein